MHDSMGAIPMPARAEANQRAGNGACRLEGELGEAAAPPDLPIRKKLLLVPRSRLPQGSGSLAYPLAAKQPHVAQPPQTDVVGGAPLSALHMRQLPFLYVSESVV